MGTNYDQALDALANGEAAHDHSGHLDRSFREGAES